MHAPIITHPPVVAHAPHICHTAQSAQSMERKNILFTYGAHGPEHQYGPWRCGARKSRMRHAQHSAAQRERVHTDDRESCVPQCSESAHTHTKPYKW